MTLSPSIETLRRITPKVGTDPEFSLSTTGAASEQLEVMRRAICQYDMRRYGMPLRELQEIVHDTAKQRGFQERYGIPFEEYARRFNEGERMGDALKGGVFQPADPAAVAAATDRANRTVLQWVAAHLEKFLKRAGA